MTLLKKIHEMIPYLHPLPNCCVLCRCECTHAYALCIACENQLNQVPSSTIIAGITAGLSYQNEVIQFVHQLKFNDKLEYALILANNLLKSINRQTLPHAIIPVPLHRQRMRQRGFNQAVEIAKPIAKQLAIPLFKQHCIRTINTQPQAELTAKQRANNIKKAFRVIKPIPDHIAIVDDVLTTGHTVTAFADCLRQAGAKKIDIWVAARTPLKFKQVNNEKRI